MTPNYNKISFKKFKLDNHANNWVDCQNILLNSKTSLRRSPQVPLKNGHKVEVIALTKLISKAITQLRPIDSRNVWYLNFITRGVRHIKFYCIHILEEKRNTTMESWNGWEVSSGIKSSLNLEKLMLHMKWTTQA